MYKRRIRKVLHMGFNGLTIMKAVNTWAKPVLRCVAPTVHNIMIEVLTDFRKEEENH